MANVTFTPGPVPQTCEGLYLHVPFCFHKCLYCDFYSIVEKAAPHQDRQRTFTDALIGELRHAAGQYRLEPTTVFVGGGTPTLLRVDLWQRLLAAIADLGLLQRHDEPPEFTVEANPETVTPELLATLAAGGVNRISIGAQTFQPHLLKALERWHDPANVARAVHACRDAGLTNLNLDLIFAIPGQTLADLDADLDTALALEPTHLSCYSLIYEPNTPLTVKLRLGQVDPVDEDTERAMYQRVMDRLADAGYEHYEVSNWAKRREPAPTPNAELDAAGEAQRQTRNGSYRCRHNLLYWHNRNWLGLGPSAASHVAGRRWKNAPHLGRYLAGSPTPPVQDVEALPPHQRTGERLMLRLRLREGVPLPWLDEHVPPTDPRRATIDELLALDLLERTDTHLRLTQRGLFVADSVIAKLL